MTTESILNSENIVHVNIDFMDEDHVEEIKLVKDLSKNIIAYKDNNSDREGFLESNVNKISRLLNDWFEHTEAHFKKENKLMEITEFPTKGPHTEEHNFALMRMATVVNSWNVSNDIELVADYVFNIWPVWFHEHKNNMDIVTAKYAILEGFDPQSFLPEEES